MRKTYLVAGMAGLALAVTLLAVRPSSSTARTEAAKAEAGKSATADLLPVSQVVLFSSGVGYFQREGTIQGDQRIDLSFRTEDINDLIKSMTLRDLDGGRVSAVSYDSNVPIERTLESFAVNLTSNPSFGQILNQARGEKVEVVLQQANATQPGTLTGSIIGVEQKQQAVDKNVVNVEVLTLWCADGMRSVKLGEVQRVRFLNAVMDSEFKKALEVLALGHDTQKKTVSLHFSGEGKRQIKVGYVVENPIWKTSYRLVLDKEKADKPYLQGWAVVENTTDEDWNDVRMALISGRPISFQMNLYDALFVKRPVVEPELFASLRPPAFTGALGRPATNGSAFPMTVPPMEPKPGDTNRGRLNRKSDNEREGKGRGGAAGGTDYYGRFGNDLAKDLKQRMDLGSSVASAASASQLGDYFQYAIDHPVSLPRQKSALLPILGKDVEGERVSIFNEQTHAKFPLLGLIFKNTTGAHLTQGPITVYEGSTYAGDARIQNLQKGEQRLLAYAIDLGTEVKAERTADSGKYTAVKVVKGIVHSTTKQEEKKTYTIVNRNEEDRTLVVEHPNRTNFKLTMEQKPWETARDVHRFKVKVPAGKTVPFTVAEQRTLSQRVALTNLNDQSIRVFLNAPVTSDAVKAALQKAMELKGKVAETQRDLQKARQQLNDITKDQQRLRSNLREMPPQAAAYKRYLQKFDDQETEIEKLREEIKALQERQHTQQKEYDSYLANLNVE